ncbi:MAG TPA: orotate phosphoribosyltransferase [Alphaproteobacteria bacterium]|nr:orotate phosphoribosyltransferase [Rhodospirillaceae bacterium]HRJ67747.1 orotate phosphoribosyltransferase [Alphaproteobacteria bacterium]
MTSSSFDRDAAAARVASLLLDIEAVHFNADTPYIFTSGWASPVYIDCRKVISFLDARREIIALGAAQLSSALDVAAIDYIAGGETAGISYAAWLSETLGKPMLYVRKKPKGFGRNARIEGQFPEGARVLLVEDLATDGASKVSFADALREAGAVVTDVFSVFFYGIYPESAKILGDAGLSLHALCTWRDVLAEARRRGSFKPEVLAEVEKFLAAPAAWSAAHGGASTRSVSA